MGGQLKIKPSPAWYPADYSACLAVSLPPPFPLGVHVGIVSLLVNNVCHIAMPTARRPESVNLNEALLSGIY
jgi:hypothetical protein